MNYRFAVVFLLLVFLFACSDGELEKENLSLEEKITFNEFGLVADSLIEIRERVKKNQTLTDILLPHKVSYQQIHNIAQVSKDVFDIRKIQSGKDYILYIEPDSVNRVKYFVYQETPLKYYVFDLSDSINVISGEKEVEIRETRIAGTIHNSLYQTLAELKVSPLLALKLSEVFAWQIDFYGIQAGDSFKIIYEEKLLDGEFMTVGRIQAAVFNHRGKDYYGFYFEEGEIPDYFDEEGNSLRKAFLKAPLKFGRISSRFSNSRLHPVLRIYRPHHGIDYAAPTGTPIQAIGDGVVVEKGYQRGNGNWLKIKHNGTYSTAYLHLSKFGKGINKGVTVRQGQIIGYVGSTGLSTGPHLDFRFYVNGKPVNFLTQEFPPSKPVDKELHEQYWTFMSDLKLKLDSLNVEQDQILASGEIEETKTVL
ncbi:MAG: peptidoglycan DD-metalloendopeptidase family protein [Melioribacteraceae bacterium]|nr:peptidoglycan DD-metalloendopeptidase family protein [Melioribacteraceae bacterium]